MTMNFITVQGAITTILGNGANGQFRVCGYKTTPEDSANIKNTNASVAVYFNNAIINKKSGLNGPAGWDVTYNIELSLGTPASADLATLNDPESTALEKAAALTAVQNTRQLANQALSTFIAAVYQILRDGSNLDLGLTVGLARSRWIENINTGEPSYLGDLLVSTANVNLTISVTETTAVVEGEPVEIIDLGMKLNADTVVRTGVTTEYE